MPRRTPTEQPTDTPVLHGHYDGPRGHEDEHRHLGGDKPHPHKRDSNLGRVAQVGEYVPGELLAQTRQKLAAQRRVLGLDLRNGPGIADPADQTSEVDPALVAEARRRVAEEQERLVAEAKTEPVPNPAGRAVVTTAEARERLRTEPPSGPLHPEVHDQAISQGIVKPKGADGDDRRDMERLRSHPDVAVNGPRPVSVSGAPGSRQADLIARVATLAILGYPAEIQQEVALTEMAIHTLMSMREEQERTKRPSDAALVTAALDAMDTIARARGLVRGGGS